MSLTLPSEYKILQGQADRIGVSQTITAQQITDANDNSIRLFSELNRRVLLEWTHPNGDDTVPAAWAEVFEAATTVGRDRDDVDIEVHVAGTDVEVRVTAWDASKSTNLGNTGTLTITATGTASGTITMSPGTNDIVLVVEYQQRSGGSGYTLLGIRCLESLLPAADIDTSWQEIAASAIAADESLASLLAMEIVKNLYQVVTQRTRAVTQAWSLRDRAIVHGVPTAGDDERRCVIPLLIPRAPWQKRHKFRLRGSAHEADVTVGIAKGFIRPGDRVPANYGETTLTAGAGVSTVSTAVSCHADESLSLYFRTFWSESGSADHYENNLATAGRTAKVEFDTYGNGASDAFSGVSVRLGTTDVWSTAGSFVDEVLPYWCRFVTALGGSLAPSDAWPGPFFVLRHVDPSAGDRALFWWRPKPPGTGLLSAAQATQSTTGVWLQRYPVGYLRYYSEEFRTDVTQNTLSLQHALEAGRQTSGLSGGRLLNALHDQLWGGYGRIHHMGPCGPDYSSSDPDSGFTGAVDKVSGYLAYTTTFTGLARCQVGHGDTFNINGGATTYKRSRYRVEALVVVWAYDNEPSPDLQVEMNFRLSVADGDGSGTTVTGTVANGGRIDAMPMTPHTANNNNMAFDVVGWWLAFYAWGVDSNFSEDPSQAQPGQMAGRGTIPADIWHRLRFYRVSLEVQDTEPGDYRALTLQASFNTATGVGQDASDFNPHVQVLTWTCYDAPWADHHDPTEWGAEV